MAPEWQAQTPFEGESLGPVYRGLHGDEADPAPRRTMEMGQEGVSGRKIEEAQR